MDRPETLVLGLGNDLVADDGFGPAVARACRRTLAGRGDVAVEEAAAAGLRLLDLLAGYRRAMILDVVQTGRVPPGTLLDWPLPESARAWTLGGSHQCDLLTALALGRRLGFDVPDDVAVLVAEASDVQSVREELTPEVAAAVPRAQALVAAWLDRTVPYDVPGGRSHAEARSLS
ncbi:MAG TPA: hydrogenase maturation protease [Thermoanaerobaculaceae bacterium]|nr:hydrogenase maturation protease [Thermoanaerobaculaceae bacterium]